MKNAVGGSFEVKEEVNGHTFGLMVASSRMCCQEQKRNLKENPRLESMDRVK